MEWDSFWQRSPLLIQASLLSSVAAIAIAWPHVPLQTVLPWFISLLLCGALWRYWADPGATEGSGGRHGNPSRTTPLRGYLAALGLGMAWGTGALALLPSLPESSQAAWLTLVAILSLLSVLLLRSTPLLAMAIVAPSQVAIGHFVATTDHHLPLVTATFTASLLALLTTTTWQFQRQADALSWWRRQASREKLSHHQSQQRFRAVFEKSPVCMIEYNGRGLVIDCNESAVFHLQVPIDPRARLNLCSMTRNAGLARAVEQSLTTGWSTYQGMYYPPAAGPPIHVRAFFHASVVEGQGASGGIAAIEPCTDMTQEKPGPYQVAYRDDLTNLPNRRAITRRLSQRVHKARQHGNNGAIVFLDLDDFKRINDSLGHLIGDRVLQTIGDRLTECADSQDFVARPGGDEFVVLLESPSDDPKKAHTIFRRAAECMLATIRSPIDIDGQTLHVTASAGIKSFGPENHSIDEIMRQVDAAMYQSKRTCKGTFQFHENWIERNVTQQMTCEIELRKALEDDQFSLMFQPVVDADGLIAGAETLLRWNHPEFGLRSPDDFIPTAEQSGLIIPMGAWVLAETIRLINGVDPGLRKRLQRVSVNISPIEFQQPDFVENVAQTIQASGSPADWLVLELTEGILLPHLDAAAEKMAQLSRLGIRFEIDDFGTGYSSLGYLKTLPVSGIKIDRGFVAGIEHHTNKAALTDALITMAQELDLYVVAEGIENAEQHRFLRERFCEWYQGFYWYKPLPWKTFMREATSPLHTRMIPTARANAGMRGKRPRA